MDLSNQFSTLVNFRLKKTTSPFAITQGSKRNEETHENKHGIGFKVWRLLLTVYCEWVCTRVSSWKMLLALFPEQSRKGVGAVSCQGAWVLFTHSDIRGQLDFT